MAIQDVGRAQGANFMMPSEAKYNVARANSAVNENKMFEMQVADRQAAAQSEQRLNELFQQSGGDYKKMREGVTDYRTASALDKQMGEQDKLQGQADKERLKAGIEKLNYGSQLLQGATPENWQQIRQEFGQMTGQDLGEQFDPNKVGALMQQGLTMKDKLANEWKEKGYNLDVAQLNETRRHHGASEAISQQNANKYSGSEGGGKPKNQIIYDANGQGYVIDVNDPTLTPRQIQTGGESASGEGFKKGITEKSFTLDQSNSATYGKRAMEAEAALNDVGTDYSPVSVSAKNAAGSVPLIGGALEMGVNTKLAPNDQKVDQAQRNFLSAVLRKESGATIGPSEIANGNKQYFPQPGDSKEVLALKSQNRATATAGLKNSAGPAWMGDSQPPQKTVVRTGTQNGRKVVQYSDGSTDYGD